MLLLFHGGLFVLAFLLIWSCAGFLIGAIERIARYFHRSGFVTAFILLGLLTSLTEISVAFNSSWQGVPQISVGNLGSASLVIFFLIIPILAMFGNGIRLQNTLNKKHLALALGVISLPPLIAATGTLTRLHGVGLIAAYSVLLYCVSQNHITPPRRGPVKTNGQRLSLLRSLGMLLVSAIIIFLAGRLLVRETIYFSEALLLPSSLIGLLVLSVGTNLPELTIALRAVLENRKTIAFGDYIGSAATNTLVLGVLIMGNGSFVVERLEFMIAASVMVLGLGLFWIFARSKYAISRTEGLLLFLVYVVFLTIQLVSVASY
jgi:cation:H+ antiporter